MKLWDYQEKAVQFINEKKRVYLALDLGMGKTITSLAAMERVANKNIMLVAEKNEIVNSQNFAREVGHFDRLSYVNLREDKLPPVSQTINVCGINPDGLDKQNPNELAEVVDAMIIDEATLAKTTSTDRFKRVEKITSRVENLVLLSGTPIMNGAAELYAPLLLLKSNLVYGKGAEGKTAFDVIFAGGHKRKIRKTGNPFKDYAWWNKGTNNVRELRWLLRDNFFFMLKGEAGIFKKKVRTIKRVSMSLPWIAEYTQAWDKYYEEAKTRDVDLDNVNELRRLIENGQMYQVNSKWKAYQAVKDIASGKYGKDRIILWTMFVETYSLLQEILKENSVSFKTFDDIQEWKAGTEQVLLGRIKAHGKGGNVPEACVSLFVDMDFVPASNIQAENRIDRPEQTRDMKIIYYMAEGEDVIDSHVRKINQDKIRKINEFMRPFTPQEIAEMPEKIKNLRERYGNFAKTLGI